MKKTTLLSLVGCTLLAAACADQEPLSPSIAPSDRANASVSVVEGETGPGAQYALHVPGNWNGNLVLYAHGRRDVTTPVDLRDQDGYHAIRDMLVAQGYAFGYSSYSENGLAVKDGAQRTHQLNGIFTSRFGRPRRVYLMGHSLGGVVAVKLAEEHPQHYAGTLPMCAQLGGIQLAADHVAHVRVLFDYFYPGVLPGDAINIPEGVDVNRDVVGPAIQAIQASPGGVGAIARIMATQQMPVPAATSAQLVESIVTALAFNFRALPDMLERTHGHSPFDNTGFLYAGIGLPAELLAHLNANVDRFSQTPDAANYLKHNYQPTGGIGAPVLTLSNALDPVSTAIHQRAYAGTVATAGKSALLLQRNAATAYGHCRIAASEAAAAFAELVTWAETGVRPAP